MLEQIYETIQAILFVELPKNNNGNIVVYDREIKGWNLGDRKLKPATPSLTLQGNTIAPKEIATATYEIEYQITIKLETGNDNQTLSEKIILEMTRLIYEALLPHRQIWVLVKCPICMKKALSPTHFTNDHPDIFSIYATQAINTQNDIWNQTHTSSMPDLPASRIAVAAFNLVLSAVINNDPVANLTSENIRAFQTIYNTHMRRIRLLYDTHISNDKPSDAGI